MSNSPAIAVLNRIIATKQQQMIQLRDNKRDKLQKKMSAHQRDMMLIDISREEIELKKKESLAVMKRSLDQTETAIASMADSMVAVGNNIKEGLTCYPKLSCRNRTCHHRHNIIPITTFTWYHNPHHTRHHHTLQRACVTGVTVTKNIR